MKKSKQCPKCQSLRVGFLPRQIDRSGEYDTSHERVLGEKEEEGLLWGTNTVQTGALEAYLCTECGYYETYIVEPEDVNWEGLKGFSWINAMPSNEGPFR